jgi:hypothetical protein
VDLSYDRLLMNEEISKKCAEERGDDLNVKWRQTDSNCMKGNYGKNTVTMLNIYCFTLNYNCDTRRYIRVTYVVVKSRPTMQ